MQLTINFEGQSITVPVEDADIEAAVPLYERMDQDLAKGWQMGRNWIESPNHMQRAQIVAHRLMLAITDQNPSKAQAMAAYLLYRLPGVQTVELDTSGDLDQTEFF